MIDDFKVRTGPFEAGWYDVVQIGLHPSSFPNSLNKNYLNCEPWSVVVTNGAP